MMSVSYAVGPRATPTVDGDRVYIVGATGRLFCFDVETGGILWQKDFVAEYGTRVPVWGIVSAPLVENDLLITVVGGLPDALVIAFDKYTGEEQWRAIEVGAEMGYAQPVIFEAGGARQLIIWHPEALTSLNPETGERYWEQPWEVSMGVTVATPVRSGEYLLVSQFFKGSLMMRLNQDRPDATRLWQGQSRSELPGDTDTLHAMVTTPLIIGDYIYGVGSYGELRGLDARTGDLIWEHEFGIESQGYSGMSRNLAIYEDKIFFATSDTRMVALDAATGELRWTMRFGDITQGHQSTSGPVIVRGTIVQGLNGCERFSPVGCYISGIDADTGQSLWSFNTVAQSDEPGGDTWANLPNEIRGGGDTWITGSYDPELDLVYYGVAQPKPWVAASRGMTVEDAALYTNSTLALRPEDGSLAWHFQYVPGETLDLDEVYELSLIHICRCRRAI